MSAPRPRDPTTMSAAASSSARNPARRSAANHATHVAPPSEPPRLVPLPRGASLRRATDRQPASSGPPVTPIPVWGLRVDKHAPVPVAIRAGLRGARTRAMPNEIRPSRRHHRCRAVHSLLPSLPTEPGSPCGSPALRRRAHHLEIATHSGPRGSWVVGPTRVWRDAGRAAREWGHPPHRGDPPPRRCSPDGWSASTEVCMCGTIICGITDSAGGRGAAELGAALSARLGLRLVLVHVIDDRSPGHTALTRRAGAERIATALDSGCGERHGDTGRGRRARRSARAGRGRRRS